ncbi:D-aminoacyl-tRNA deacylase [Bombiscardovia coagulans]|uniref:D-aminoacyl-tRNA deacylase n=1 Tax=Bombiscardovia coagulans TaxID=686666 RepID=UPI000B9BF968|nr:D-aminoacyl-tRNA deacylase [Bombiscardovia coagulans]
MKVLIQRVSQANVDVVDPMSRQVDQSFDPQEIHRGLLLLVGVSNADGEQEVAYAARKIANMRIFEDTNGRMNRSVIDVTGEILSISQFTLYADTRHGNRPSFHNAGKPDHAETVWNNFNRTLSTYGIPVKTGRFGAHMRVQLLNDGPVTISLDTAETQRSQQP